MEPEPHVAVAIHRKMIWRNKNVNHAFMRVPAQSQLNIRDGGARGAVFTKQTAVTWRQLNINRTNKYILT